ncbi:helix-turn-helix domain-containing protein [Rhizobium calliandrae]
MHANVKPAVPSCAMPAKIVRAQIPRVHSIVTCQRGEQIYAEGDATDKCFQVSAGAVRVSRVFANGGRQVVSFHLAGEMFGFEAGPQHRFFAEAIAETRMAVFERGPVQQHLPELLALAVDGMERAQEHLVVIGRQSAIERVALFLTDLSNRLGGTRQLTLAMSRQDIADYLALTIETVSRAITELRERSVIALRHARIVYIMNPDALRSLCGDAASPSEPARTG